MVYENYRESRCATNVVRMGNPCTEIDMQRLRQAYQWAQEVLSQDVSQAPDEIRGYDTYLGVDSTPQLPSECQTYETNRSFLRPYSVLGRSAFYDCGYIDNYHLFQDFSRQHGWLPPDQ